MDHQTFTWGRSGSKIRRTQRWVERMCLLGLLLAALILFCIHLDSPPLLHGREQVVSQVADHLNRIPIGSWQWLYPAVPDPPLIYWLIGGAYQLGTVNEWTTRLPDAVLTALSVCLLYGIGREIFPTRQGAIFSSLMYLTLWPVVYSGRLATGDGALLCFVLLMIGCVLRSRRDFRWALGVGIGLGLICLTKGIWLGLLLWAIALLFLAWDTPRLLTSVYWWLGWLLGMMPCLAWYSLPLLSSETLMTSVIKQGFYPFWIAIAQSNQSPGYSLVEFWKSVGPWFLFWPYGLRLAWENRNWGWAKLVLIWSGVYLGAMGLMMTHLSGYSLPLYPALALAGGAQFAEIWNGPSSKPYPRFWSIGLNVMALAAVAGAVYWALQPTDQSGVISLMLVGLTLAMSGRLAAQRDVQFMVILFWGMYISLLVFLFSPHWSWQFPKPEPAESIAIHLQGDMIQNPYS